MHGVVGLRVRRVSTRPEDEFGVGARDGVGAMEVLSRCEGRSVWCAVKVAVRVSGVCVCARACAMVGYGAVCCLQVCHGGVWGGVLPASSPA